ncbi:hypothetical protein GIB67_040923 [Kingdonia uniflora]|uniref:ABC1 atypical kinase-like domain-containing protein n=1 Tax=Kingdonia uniflora TaxID=39325 RepID=A0A7J7PC47_9MAGN|nr:hypothetical protein GIB67_040923 [Kingdonia uniflora]
MDALPTFPDVEAFSYIKKKLGLSLDTIYSSITPSSVAAASLGQVYKSRLKYYGQYVAVKASNAVLGNFVNLDFFHVGPHPGNLLATPEGKLAFHDFGMMSEILEEARFAIIGHIVQMVNRDYETMAQD